MYEHTPCSVHTVSLKEISATDKFIPESVKNKEVNKQIKLKEIENKYQENLSKIKKNALDDRVRYTQIKDVKAQYEKKNIENL